MGRIALLSDVHGNLVALEAVLAAVGRVDAIWVTGDSVGYGPDPSDVLALLRERGGRVVAGNHDLAVATGAGLELFNPHAAAAARLHHRWLTAEERDRLAALPLTLEADGFTLCHGSLRDPLWEYVLSARQALTTLRLAATPCCAIGHTHVPALFRSGAGATRPAAEGYGLLAAEPLVATAESFVVGRPIPLEGRMLVNSGSVGQPRDGDPRAAYAVLDTDAGPFGGSPREDRGSPREEQWITGTLTFERASYDVGETQRRMRARGLPDFLADRLAVGF